MSDEERDGVSLSSLDQPLFDGADATKRDLVDYLDAVRDRILPVLKSPRPGAAPVPVDGHPFVLHRSWLAAQDWTLGQLVDALKEIAEIDAGVKSGAGTGPELLEAFLLARAEPPGRANGKVRPESARS
jgi:hypothetical protein